MGYGSRYVGSTRFSELYQIAFGHADNDADESDLSQDEEGVKSGHVEGSHSPFGLIYQIAKDTGWSVEYILKLPYVTLVLMMADAPRYVSGKKKDEPIRITSKEQLFGALGKNG